MNHMQMKNGDTGEVMWQVNSWDLNKEFHTENITKNLLECKRVIRNVNFSSEEKIEDLELIQNLIQILQEILLDYFLVLLL